MKKKYVSILMVFIMLFSMIGCGKKDDSSNSSLDNSNSVSEATPTDKTENKSDEKQETITLRVAWWGGQTRNERLAKAFDLYMELNPHIIIEQQIKPHDDHWTDMAASATSDTMPDLFFSNDDKMAPYVNAGKYVELTPYVESGALDISDVPENILDTSRLNGGLYGVSVGNNVPALIYNKTLLDENGIEIHDYMTVDEFMDLCREIDEKTGVKTEITGGVETVQFLLRGQGLRIYGDGKFGIDSYEPFVQFFNIIETGLKEGWLIDQAIVSAAGTSAEQSTLVNYTTPDTQSWSRAKTSNTFINYQKYAPEGVELGLTTRYSDNVEKSNYLKQAMQWSIATNSKHIDETVALLNWIINSEEFNEIMLGETGVPASSKMAEHVSGILDDAAKKTFTFFNDVAIPKSSSPDPVPPSGAKQIDSLISDLEEKVGYGVMTAEEAAKELFEQGNKILAEQQGK